MQITPLDVSQHWHPAWCEQLPSLRFELAPAAAVTPPAQAAPPAPPRQAGRTDAFHLDLHRQPDGSAWWCADGPPHAESVNAIFDAALQHAGRHHVRLLHAVVFRESGLSDAQLTRFGFSQADCVEHWQSDGPLLHPRTAGVEIGRLVADEDGLQFHVQCGPRCWSVSRASVCRLIKRTWQDSSPGIGEFVPRAADLLTLWLWLVPAAELHVAVCNDSLLGLLVSTRQNADITVQYLGLRPAYRRQGIGSALLHNLTAANRSVATGVHAFVMGGNLAAKQCYQRLGFTARRTCRPWFRRIKPSP